MASCRDCGKSVQFLLEMCDACSDSKKAQAKLQARSIGTAPVNWKFVLGHSIFIFVAVVLLAAALGSESLARIPPRLISFSIPIILFIGFTIVAARSERERSKHTLLVAIIVWLAYGLVILVLEGFAAFWSQVPTVVMYVALALGATLVSFAIVRSEKILPI